MVSSGIFDYNIKKIKSGKLRKPINSRVINLPLVNDVNYEPHTKI